MLSIPFHQGLCHLQLHVYSKHNKEAFRDISTDYGVDPEEARFRKSMSLLVTKDQN